VPAKTTSDSLRTPSKQTPVLSLVKSEEDLDRLRMPADGHKLDVRYVHLPWQQRRAIGRGLRERASRESHAIRNSGTNNRPDPLDLLDTSNVGW
jgi:hypothetical protein